MTLLALGWAAEYAEAGVASNTLWPESIIATAAVQNLLGGDDSMSRARSPEIVADAAMEIVTSPARECTGNTFIDVDVLRDGRRHRLQPVRRAERPDVRPVRRSADGLTSVKPAGATARRSTSTNV